jgi:sigma-B regulation protein RsbU (phosphoserine phosphatase)
MISAMRADMFITMIYAVVDADASLITLARAGHEAPLIYRAATPDEPAEKIRAQGMAVGMVEPELFDSSITDVSVPFGRGDILVLYTDGVTEAVNNGGEEFGAARLARTVATLGSRSAEDLNDELITALERFTHASANYTDDLTLLSVKKL